ncbi:hypothetical protein LEP1GSC065_1174 [Leptospira kirschneri serovar Sokoine str. RM1]|nr:hypothetical protein LEP1GSC065_1174 [Leptospira kirschneri serovar Sokoine str. RM1]
MFLEYRSYYIEKLFAIVGTLTKHNFTGWFCNCGNSYKTQFYRLVLQLWELLQNLGLSVK